MLGSWSDRARIIVGSCSDRPRIGNDVSSALKDFLRNFVMQFQAQYLVMLEGEACCSAHCKGRFICDERMKHASLSAWQAQHLVNF